MNMLYFGYIYLGCVYNFCHLNLEKNNNNEVKLLKK